MVQELQSSGGARHRYTGRTARLWHAGSRLGTAVALFAVRRADADYIVSGTKW